MVDWRAYSRELAELLRLRTLPVAVKFSEEELGGGAEPPMTVCQMVSRARVFGETVVANRRTVFCVIAKRMLGLAELPPDVPERFAGLRTETAEAYARILDDMPKVELGRYSSVVISPLESVEGDPDVILVFANGAQMTRLLHAATWKTGERVSVRTAAEAGTCGEAIAAAFVRGSYTVAFPCYGTRVYGLAADDEIIFSYPASLAEELLEGLRRTHEFAPYPPRVQMRPASEIPRARKFVGP